MVADDVDTLTIDGYLCVDTTVPDLVGALCTELLNQSDGVLRGYDYGVVVDVSTDLAVGVSPA